MKKIFLTLWILIVLMTTACRETPAFSKWAAEHASVIETVEPGSSLHDLEPLRRIVGNAKIVCLGESLHDAKEQFKLKHRMIEFLVKEMGFTVFIFEESLPYSREIDRYILTGRGDPAQLLENIPMWFIWDTQEILDMVRWMRTYNADDNHKKKIRFFGMDVTAPKHGMDTVFTYLERVDPVFATSFTPEALGLDLVNDRFWPATRQAYRALSSMKKNQLRDNYQRLVTGLKEKETAYTAASSPEEYQWALRSAEVGLTAGRLFSQENDLEGGLIRDRGMFDNVQWIMRRRAPGEKIILWAHNAHIGRKGVTMPGRFGDSPLESVGCRLSDAMGKDMVTIAAAFNRGKYGAVGTNRAVSLGPARPDSLDGALAGAGKPLFLLDLRAAPKTGPTARRLSENQRMQAQDADMMCRPGETYDAVFFVDHITRTTLNKQSRKKLAQMRSR